MEKILYTKLSNQRNPKFCIRTDIVQTDAGRVVRKYPTEIAGKAHVMHMTDAYTALTTHFADSKFKANKLIPGENYVEFEYLECETLEELLDSYLRSKNYDAFEKLMRDYAKRVRAVYATDIFESSEKFVSVFGERRFEGTLRGTCMSDIDLVFSNILCNEDTWTVIDYEWTFDFLIPVDYILWRSCMYYLNGAELRSKRYVIEDLCKFMEIDMANAKNYEQMENHFQSEYCYKDVQALVHLYPKMGQPINDNMGDFATMLGRKNEELAQARRHIEDIHHSTSWRVTKPIRKVSAIIKGENRNNNK